MLRKGDRVLDAWNGCRGEILEIDGDECLVSLDDHYANRYEMQISPLLRAPMQRLVKLKDTIDPEVVWALEELGEELRIAMSADPQKQS